MRKIVVLLCILFMSYSVAFSATKSSSQISLVEKQLFGYEYQSDTESVRLDRIEHYLYGSKSSGALTTRLNKVVSDVGIVTDSTAETKKIATQNNSAIGKNAAAPVVYPKDDPNVEYPVVDKMEKKVFNRTFVGESVYARLDRLENKIYKSTCKDDLNSRVNKLRVAVLDIGEDDSSSASAGYYDDSSFLNRQSDYDKIGSKSYDDSNNFEQSDDYNYVSPKTTKDNYLNMELLAAEQSALNETYQSESNKTRLSRLENEIFKRTFPNDTDGVRLQRISAVGTAQKTSKNYDNNKFSRNMSTGMQIGSFLLMILAMIL